MNPNQSIAEISRRFIFACIMPSMMSAALFIAHSAWGAEKNAAAGKSGAAREEEGLVAYYSFDEGKGETAGDHSGRKNDGEIHGGAEYVKVGHGHALSFDGRHHYVDCGAGQSLDLQSAGAVMCWFNAEEPQGGLITRSTSTRWEDERLVLSLRTPGGLLVWALGDGKESQFRQHEGIASATWTHVALTFDGTSVICYRDGARLVAEAQEVTPKIKDVPLLIGRSQGLGQEYFKGLIDEVRIYNRALTAREILDYYQETQPDHETIAK